jgi:hypothetical protein
LREIFCHLELYHLVARKGKVHILHFLCSLIAAIILEYNPAYKHPGSLAGTIIEMAHLQVFFMHHLPSLTDFGESKDEQIVVEFPEDLVFCSIVNRGSFLFFIS